MPIDQQQRNASALQPAHVLWEDVDSSNVNRVAYHDKTKTLCVEFNNGGLYAYADVPDNHYHALVGAESVGRYLNNMIKGSYQYSRFETEDALLLSLARQ